MHLSLLSFTRHSGCFASLIPPFRELKARDNQPGTSLKAEEPLVLLPLEVMVRPLELRFQYHFDGDRPTNRVDKVCFSGRLLEHRINSASPSISFHTLLVYLTLTMNSSQYTCNLFYMVISRDPTWRSPPSISILLLHSSLLFCRCSGARSPPIYRAFQNSPNC